MIQQDNIYESYWIKIWRQFRRHRLGLSAFYLVLLFCFTSIYAPFFASSKPIAVEYNGDWYFPLFRYLLYSGYYTKRLDIFFNLLIFTVPAATLAILWFRRKTALLVTLISLIASLQLILFAYYIFGPMKDPASNLVLNTERQQALKEHPNLSWNFDLKYMNPYAKLNLVLRYEQRLEQHRRLQNIVEKPDSKSLPTLWQIDEDNEYATIERQHSLLESLPKDSKEYIAIEAKLNYILDKRKWIEQQTSQLHYMVMPLIRPFHWEDDAGGGQSLNQHIPWWELTRINRKDLVAALIFGVRISLVVGLLAVAIALMIGIPVGAYAGFYGGRLDILVSRLLEIWESMPTFFMLLMVVAILQNKSIFLVIAVIGIFGWTNFSRYIRGEFFKQRNLSYVEACRGLGFRNSYIMFSHIMPNAIPPLLTLLPFAIMGAITSEAALSFLGLGEEGSCSWGVLMDEGRTAFPGESYLLWPPAILLTILLVAIALVGDAFRDALDPKMQR